MAFDIKRTTLQSSPLPAAVQRAGAVVLALVLLLAGATGSLAQNTVSLRGRDRKSVV